MILGFAQLPSLKDRVTDVFDGIECISRSSVEDAQRTIVNVAKDLRCEVVDADIYLGLTAKE